MALLDQSPSDEDVITVSLPRKEMTVSGTQPVTTQRMSASVGQFVFPNPDPRWKVWVQIGISALIVTSEATIIGLLAWWICRR